MEDEDIVDPQDIEPEEILADENIYVADAEDEEDEEDEDIVENIIIENIEDINVFNKNYDKMKQNNRTTKFISKYEKCKILSKRCEQLESGCLPLISDHEIFNNIYDIALEELNQKKIPFILKRFMNNKYEYWKLKDLIN
jgi:DNA-directed RNA polymerases I, II, and III subunit RPABC2